MTVAQYPAYDPTAESTWTIGAQANTTNLGTYVGVTGTTDKWGIHSMRLDLQPGTYTLTNFKWLISLAANVNCDAVRIGILQGNTTAVTYMTFASGLNYIDVTSGKADTDAMQLLDYDIANEEITIVAGTTYWLCFGLHGIDGRTTGRPGFKGLVEGGNAPMGENWVALAADSWGATLDYYAAGAGYNMARVLLTLKTKNRVVYSGAYAAAKKVFIPTRTDGDYWITFEDAVVADGQAFTAVLGYDVDANESARTTMVLDMGATDQVTFGGANIALAAAGAEAGDSFYLGINMRPATGKADLFYQNRTTGQGAEGVADFVTISHACKNGSARTLAYTVGRPGWLRMAGTAAVATIKVSSEMVVAYGDSQCRDTSDRFAKNLPAAFTYPRAVWHGWISGNRLTEAVGGSHTAGYLRYKHGTPGLGDLCEMTGVLFAVCSFGVNDVSAQVGTTETNRNKMVGLFATRMAEILDDLQDRGIQTLIIGLPPYSDGNASTQEAKVIQHQINPMLEGLSLGVRCAYVNPWWAMCQGGTSENDVPTFNSDYTVDGGLHYSPAGNLLVSQMAAMAVESGIVGGWWSRRRSSRQNGSLFPI